MRERLRFLDAVRGWALLLMVLNHTGRWWQDGRMTWPRYYVIYVSLTLAAPMFLFLVGFCLPLSGSRAGGGRDAALGKWAARGARLILAGLLLNLLVFPEDPIWNNGVLQTIGFGILIAAPAALLLIWPLSAPSRSSPSGWSPTRGAHASSSSSSPPGPG
ncbi:MAG: DUF1624 domain-containing protein [Candidatus Rokubacteria bacterium]|nr:DUF1624 domain-containing protein [Candidatus Rokubacteria bacterium]